MGFWKTFTKIAVPALSIAAIPFSGGTSLLGMAGLGGGAAAAGGAAGGAMGLGSILGNVGKIGEAVSPILGGLAQGRAQGKQQDYQNESAHGNALNNALLQEMAAKINAANQNQGMRSRLAGDAVRGDMIANVQDVNIPDNGRVKVAHFGGGMRPSAMGPNARQAGSMLSSGALSDMGQPGIQAPGLTGNVADLPTNGFLDKLLGVATPALGTMGALYGKGGPLAGQGGQGPAPAPLQNKLQGMEDLLMDPMRGIQGLNQRDSVY